MTEHECDELSPLRAPSDPVFRPLPVPGTGGTAARFEALWNIARRSPSLGRLAEAHHDAVAILHEAGRTDIAPGLHGVWAAGGPDPLLLARVGDGWRLRGSKHWCSGATLATRALVTAELPNGLGALVLVDLTADGVRPAPPTWESPALRAVDTRTVHFDLAIGADAIVGVDDWYLRRPGFWHGSVGVAACWAGCVDGIVSRLQPRWRSDPHAVAHLGAIDALLWSLRTLVAATGDAIDAEPVGEEPARQQRAMRIRHVVVEAVDEIIDRIPRALGPGPLALEPNVHRHLAETDLYRRQSQAERDLESLGELSRTVVR